MANKVRIRVELKKKYNDPAKNFKDMLQEYKRRLNNSGILKEYKEHEFYESPRRKDRKKRQEAIKKCRMDNIERKILSGEDVNMSNGLYKKVISNLNKDKEKDRDRKDTKQIRQREDD